MSLIDLSLPDDAVVSDSLVTELVTLEPRIEDTIATLDAVAVEQDKHVELLDAVAVSDAVAVAVITLEPNLSDAVAVTDNVERLWEKGILQITSIVPERGEPGDIVAINGSGFDPSGNSVGFDIVAVSVFISESPTQLIVEVPSTFRGFSLPVKVTRADGRFDAIEWWCDETLDTLKSFRLPQQLPGFKEDQNTEAPGNAEAQDMERIAVLAEFLWHDLLRNPGVIHTHDGTQMVPLPAAGTLGHTLVADSVLDEGVGFQAVYELALAWGGEIPAATATEVSLLANEEQGVATGGTNTTHAAPFAGTIDRLWLLVKNAGATDTLDQVRILVNSVEEYDSGAGLGLANNGSHRPSLSIAIAVGDLIEVLVTKSGATDAIGLVGGLRLTVAP